MELPVCHTLTRGASTRPTRREYSAAAHATKRSVVTYLKQTTWYSVDNSLLNSGINNAHTGIILPTCRQRHPVTTYGRHTMIRVAIKLAGKGNGRANFYAKLPRRKRWPRDTHGKGPRASLRNHHETDATQRGFGICARKVFMAPMLPHRSMMRVHETTDRAFSNHNQKCTAYRITHTKW